VEHAVEGVTSFTAQSLGGVFADAESSYADDPCAGEPRSEWLLARDSYLAATAEGGAFILDTRRDQYFGFDPLQLQVLERHVKGWPVGVHRSCSFAASGTSAPVDPQDETRLLENLCSKGILTRDTARGKSAEPIRIVRPQRTLIEEDLESHIKVRLNHLLNFTWAMMRARRMRRRRPLLEIIETVRKRKAKRLGQTPQQDPAYAAEVVAVFDYLRPLLFSGRDQCVLNSLGLTLYLSRYGIFPDWIWGVQSQPFLAHCWLQTDTRVWNDIPERVARFTPIAVF
jgi:hypothetical protein